LRIISAETPDGRRARRSCAPEIGGLAALSSTGIDGAPLNWPLCEEGMLAFQRDTLPLLKQAGLR
jgi:hypothetical protein